MGLFFPVPTAIHIHIINKQTHTLKNNTYVAVGTGEETD